MSITEHNGSSSATTIAELREQFEIAWAALRRVNLLTRQLQRSAAEAVEAAGGMRIVRVNQISPPPVDPKTGRRVKRGRGRPKGSPNNITIMATAAEIETLKAQLTNGSAQNRA